MVCWSESWPQCCCGKPLQSQIWSLLPGFMSPASTHLLWSAKYWISKVPSAKRHCWLGRPLHSQTSTAFPFVVSPPLRSRHKPAMLCEIVCAPPAACTFHFRGGMLGVHGCTCARPRVGSGGPAMHSLAPSALGTNNRSNAARDKDAMASLAGVALRGLLSKQRRSSGAGTGGPCDRSNWGRGGDGSK